MYEPNGDEKTFYRDDDTASFDDDPLPRALADYGLEDVAALDQLEDDDPFLHVHILVAEHVARQYLNQHCPTWTTFLLEAILSCIDFRRALRIGTLPGDGAGKTRNIVYEHRAVGEIDNLWMTRQAIADPLDAGISPVGFVAGQLAPRLRVPVTYAADPPTPVLICFAKPDFLLSGREDRIMQVFVPKAFSWAEGTARISTLTRSAFADLLQRVQSQLAAILQLVPTWNVIQALHEDLVRIERTTGSAKRPTTKDKASISLAIRALRNLVGAAPELAVQIAQLDYVYRRYEVLR